jgi:hypothetical protein
MEGLKNMQASHHSRLLFFYKHDSTRNPYLHIHSGIGLETCILFAREGANVLMADISGPALEKASAKLNQLVPSALKVETKVSSPSFSANPSNHPQDL